MYTLNLISNPVDILVVTSNAPSSPRAASPYDTKEGNVLYNDALNTFYLRLYSVGSGGTKGGGAAAPGGTFTGPAILLSNVFRLHQWRSKVPKSGGGGWGGGGHTDT